MLEHNEPPAARIFVTIANIYQVKTGKAFQFRGAGPHPL